MKTPQTILAIDPGLRDLGRAVLCGRRLVDAGVETFRFVPGPERHAAVLSAVRAWINRYKPDVLVLEATPGDHEPPFDGLRRLERSLRSLASRRNIPCVVYTAQSVRKALLGNGWARKRDVAVALAARYPTLRVFLRQDRQWKERYFQNMFDALALAVYHQDHGRQPTPALPQPMLRLIRRRPLLLPSAAAVRRRPEQAGNRDRGDLGRAPLHPRVA